MKNRTIISRDAAKAAQETFKQLLLNRAAYDSTLPPNLEGLAVVYERNIRFRCSVLEEYERECLDFNIAIKTNQPLKAVVTLNFSDADIVTEEERAEVRCQMKEVIKYNSSAALNKVPAAILDDIIKKKEAQAFEI